jgi:hypothetical protein
MQRVNFGYRFDYRNTEKKEGHSFYSNYRFHGESLRLHVHSLAIPSGIPGRL